MEQREGYVVFIGGPCVDEYYSVGRWPHEGDKFVGRFAGNVPGGMIANAAYYLKKGVLKAPLHFQFCMGCANGIPGSLKNLIFMKETMESLCPGSTWSCFGVGHCALEMLYGAVALGGHIRVGMEDNVMYAKGVLAESNVQFVERARRVIEEYGKQVATPAEARGILGLK